LICEPFSLDLKVQEIAFWPGDLSDVVPLDSIPNSKVKRVSGDDSSWATERENTSLPGHFFKLNFIY
jgi:hypothetical protein